MKPRKPKIPPGVVIDDRYVHFPPIIFPEPEPDDQDLKEWEARVNAIFEKQMDKWVRFARAYEKWDPDSKYNREKRNTRLSE